MQRTMRYDGSETHAVREWLEDAWRHGEVVADGDGGLTQAAAQRPVLSPSLSYAQRLLQATRASLWRLRRAD